jgi:hypothetical protein
MFALIAILLFSGCSNSSSSSSGANEDANVEETYTPPPKPECTDVIDSKKINRNPEAFIGKCGVLYLKIIDAQNPDDCQVRANYDSAPFEYGDYESYMGFYECKDAENFYTGDYYKVTALVNGEFSFTTVLGASRTLADLTIIDVIG